MKKNIFLILFFLFVNLNLFSQIVLTEIMYNPEGSEYYDEFLEFYNNSDQPYDLTNCKVGDQSGLGNIINIPNSKRKNLIVPPKTYFLILDNGYFANSTTYDNLNCLIFTLNTAGIGNNGLSNSTPETIIFKAANGDTLVKYTYSPTLNEGYTWEKINLDLPDINSNWGCSLVKGGTPGSQNSIAIKNFDLKLNSCKFENNKFIFNIKNVGANAFNDSLSINIIDKWSNYISNYAYKCNILQNDSLFLEFDKNFNNGYHNFYINLIIQNDENLANNIDSLKVRTGDLRLLINEINVDANNKWKDEWVELWNKSEFKINLKNWSFNDGTTKKIINTDYWIEPDEFIILCKSKASFQYFGNSKLFEAVTSLSNTGDKLYLYDENSNCVDSLQYFANWFNIPGASLERISPLYSTNLKENWYCAVNPEKGTPGLINSIYSDIEESNNFNVNFNCKSFYPQKSENNFLKIDVSMEDNYNKIMIYIYDIRGRLIRKLADGEYSGKNKSFIWDGKDDSSNLCSMGIYLVNIKTIGSNNGKSNNVKKIISLLK